MGKTRKNTLPRARIAHRSTGRLAFLTGCFRPLRRLRFGQSELVAVSIVGGIVMVVGLMLAGFGAANRHGLSEKYLVRAADSESAPLAEAVPMTESELWDAWQGTNDYMMGRPSSLVAKRGCRFIYAEDSPCREIWARAMAGALADDWSGDEDWYESQCRFARVCYPE